MAARTYSAALTGLRAHLVEIETDIRPGLPAMIFTGLQDTALRETRDRVRAAVVNSGQPWPGQIISTCLYPASLPKHGGALDTAIAVSILAAAGLVPGEVAAGVFWFAELGLDGRLRPVRGVLPALAAAKPAGCRVAVVAPGNAAEAALVRDVTVTSMDTLAEVITWMREDGAAREVISLAALRDTHGAVTGGNIAADPAGDAVQETIAACMPETRAAAEICAAGGHHLSILGPAGTPKAPVARLVRALLPGLDHDAALEVTAVHSAAGTLRAETPLVTNPPFCAPHHSATRAMIIGGGIRHPGVASLAHRGVLFLDQAPEFGRDVLDALRQPLESGTIVIARSDVTVTFPARFILVLAANPCPCENAADPAEGCSCAPATRRRYLRRLSGPLLDRVDVKIGLRPAERTGPPDDSGRAGPSSAAAARVTAARERTARRLAGTPWLLNAEVPGSELRRHWPPAPGALTSVERALERGQISARSVIKVIRVAWTLADLTAMTRPGRDECDTALSLYLGEPA
jgi:magnesium chelatase family protein